jgi:DNA-directed RNA polymerase subunit H (RpoH/RPB5)
METKPVEKSKSSFGTERVHKTPAEKLDIAFKTACSMLYNRGWIASPLADYSGGNKMTIPTTARGKHRTNCSVIEIAVYFLDFGPNTQLEQKPGIYYLIAYNNLLVKQPTKKNYKDVNPSKIELVRVVDLQFDLITHDACPSVSVIPFNAFDESEKKERDDVISSYAATEKQFHKIKIDDPLAKYYKLQSKDIIRCVSASESLGSIRYRIVP